MIEKRPFSKEKDFETMLDIESRICGISGLSWQFHIGGLIFDRFLFGKGEDDIYSYGYLIYEGNKAAGYLLAYSEENEFLLRLLPENEGILGDILDWIKNLFPESESYSTILSDTERDVIGTYKMKGFMVEGAEKYLGVIDLEHPIKEPVKTDSYISVLSDKDLIERTRYANLPIDHDVDYKVFEKYYYSVYHNYAEDLVLRKNITDEMIGYITWWIDIHSRTALLEPVACLKEFRGRGYMKNLILNNLKMLKEKGIRYAYVSTSIDHYDAIGLYEACGFLKSSEGVILTKLKS